MNYKLPFNHTVIATLAVKPDYNFVTIQKATPPQAPLEFVTYQYNADTGDCYWGHYGLREQAEAVLNMIARSPVPIITIHDLAEHEFHAA